MATSILWPARLPTPTQTGYAASPIDNLVSSDMDSGWQRTRVISVRDGETITVSWVFDWAEAAFFEAWYRDVLARGSLSFMLPVAAPAGIFEAECKFRGSYTKPQHNGGAWTVSATLDIWERPMLPEGMGDWTPELIIDSALLDIAINRYAPEA